MTRFKKQVFLAALLLLTISSCISEIDKATSIASDANRNKIFYATTESSEPDTKVYADANMKVLWNADDRLSIFNQSTYNSQFRFTGDDGDNAGGFEEIPASGFISGNTLSNVYAVYPYSSTNKINNAGTAITMTLPAEQAYKEHSFGVGANTMIAATSNHFLAFKNVGGYLSLRLYGDNVSVSRITLQGNNHEKIAGKAEIAVGVGTAPSVTMTNEATETISIVCDPAVKIGTSSSNYTDFWFVIPPVTFTKGFTVTVTDNLGGTFEVSTSKSFTISRSTVEWMSALKVVPKQGTIPPDNEIWYTTSDNSLISFVLTKPFDVNVVSHTYENGKGIIRCDAPITTINADAFNNYLFGCYGIINRLTNIFLPNSITKIEQGAFFNTTVTELRIPDNLQYVGGEAFVSKNLQRFTGNQTTEDGRCIILRDGYFHRYNTYPVAQVKNCLAGFAPSGLTEYVLPSNIEVIGSHVFHNSELKTIVFNEGLKIIYENILAGVDLDCEINLPSTLEWVEAYAFNDCSGIKGFYGNDKFHTVDHMCLTIENYYGKGRYIIQFVGEELESYTIPEGIVGIEHYAFRNMTRLRSITFPSTITDVQSEVFEGCVNLEAIYGDCASEDHRGIVFDDTFRRLLIAKGITKYTVPEGIKRIGHEAFSGLSELEEVVIPDSVIELGGYDFFGCRNLKRITLSSNLKNVGITVGDYCGNLGWNPFLGSSNIEEIYFRSFIPPIYTDTQFRESDCKNLTVYVPEETLELYKNSGWYQYAPYMVGYHYDDIGEWNPDYYMSSDYSADGAITTLQQSATGAGIDLILMGDAFSDRQIADGTYASVMQKATNAFFSEEPYKSMKNRFNVYTVNVVSATEGYEHSGQALGTGHGDGTYVSGNDSKVIEYAKSAVGENRLDDALVIVMMNEDAYAGTCFMYNPPSGNYARGLSIAYFPTSSDTDTFNGLVSHEAGGHGFAKLADEYAYESMGAISADAISDIKAKEPYGWWKNVDFTSDPALVKWSQFLSDARYSGEGLGCYEGGLTYWTGVWRPTEASIMRYNTGGFNAPSRYAIWYRIGKLANGENWEGSYEDFVAYDAINRSAATSTKASRPNYVTRSLPKSTPPVVVGHGWREELQKSR